ncbi:MAG: flagellar hook-length control protein FliK [Rhodocyclaceae bacterium]|nr:flagellar hook-length control protein FliK [Rhodocyclaceae bacterium]MCB1907770.1 flagellar hook-length control protein FliK [Rhodocyclaceae bacterium]
MIPADLTARLRLLTEASFFSKEPREVGPLRNATAVSKDPPDFLPGQRIVATLGEARAENIFRALIEGREYTLTLPRHSARSGQTLELIVTHATPRAVIATPADGNTAASAARLSQTGRLISFLLTGQPPAPPAQLAGGRPLLQTPPASGAPLAAALRQAIGESGLFYESQLARWLSGNVSTEMLLRQPQGQLTGGRAALPGGGADGPPADATRQGAGTAASRAPPTPSSPPPSQTATAAPGADAEEVAATSHGTATQRNPGPANASAVPERLMPLLHQQLDALATSNYAWQGAAWPGQPVEIEIEEPEERDGDGSDDGEATWKTTLRVTLPRLGGIEARLQLSSAGVALQLTADDAATAASFAAAEEDLAAALATAGLPLAGLTVAVRSNAEESR